MEPSDYLQVSAPPWQPAPQGLVNPADGRFLWVDVHDVQAGAAPLLYQSRNTWTTQDLLELLDKLEECPEMGKEKKKKSRENVDKWEREGRKRNQGQEALTDVSSPPTV